VQNTIETESSYLLYEAEDCEASETGESYGGMATIRVKLGHLTEGVVESALTLDTIAANSPLGAVTTR
jgi:hypothetical protein